jgi:hypothetical protein
MKVLMLCIRIYDSFSTGTLCFQQRADMISKKIKFYLNIDSNPNPKSAPGILEDGFHSIMLSVWLVLIVYLKFSVCKSLKIVSYKKIFKSCPV